MVPVATHEQWLLGFEWLSTPYAERCLPFGLSTAPFLFNLFAEGLHWILEACLELADGWLMHHYIDDFIVISRHLLRAVRPTARLPAIAGQSLRDCDGPTGRAPEREQE
jgi:hypothetical protein